MRSITVQEYADRFDVTTVAVTRACKKGKKLKGIKSYKLFNRTWILTTNPNYDNIVVTYGQIVEKAEKSEADF